MLRSAPRLFALLRFRREPLALVCMLALSGCIFLVAAERKPADLPAVKGANFKQAYKFSPDFLKKFVHSTAVTPTWIGKTDSFWYQYTTSKGKQWYRVNPREASKEPLFDRVKVGAQLSELLRKPLDPHQLPITTVTLNDEATKLKFVTDDLQFEYDLRDEKLTKLGKAPPPADGPAGMDAEQAQKLKEKIGDELYKQLLEKQKTEKKDGGSSDDEDELADFMSYLQDYLAERGMAHLLDIDVDFPQQKKGGKGGQKGGAKGGKGNEPEIASPDKKFTVYALNNNLYLAEADDEDAVIQLTKDSADQYTFNAAKGFGGAKDIGGEVKDQKAPDPNKDKKVRPNATWSKDSKVFYATRADTRGIKELFLINAIANPRPTLTRYTYPMPGDENIRKTELYVLHISKKKLIRVEPKWKDETYTDLHWGKASDELRFIRNDRLHRNAEFCTLNTVTGECKCLILEGFENSSLETKPMRYIDESDEMIWWSERSNWGHFYLYDRAGKLKNAITCGDFRASAIEAVDPKNRMLYFRGNAREPGENVYFNHLYSVHFDGTGLTLLDPGDANHDSRLSPSRQYVVDNTTRFDGAPSSVLRDARGNKIMDLEKTDLSKLVEVGWKMPETFIVKAADGVTDLYGQMWKPFDFDAKKKYPIIANVYPGPQTESMNHSFQPTATQQQLAQLNFIVIQVGNRGGTPLRSKSYQAYSYWNMRDYGLADKKTAIEQLAATCPWIDIERIGIYGHSGGGFMSTAALLVKPYNDFFKVAVSSAGNHDNNVYNNSWAERYHGMKELPGAKQEAKAETPPKKDGFKGGGKKKGGGGDFPPDGDDESPQQKDEKKTEEQKKDEKESKDSKDSKATKDDMKAEKAKEPTHYEIRVPTNPELAANLKGKLLLVHGDMDNNVHPAHTIRMVDALIKANKRFDMLILPGKAHGFADYQPYFVQRMWEYFAEHLLDDRCTGADIYDRK
jgi:dipeptidyl-peptidase 4